MRSTQESGGSTARLTASARARGAKRRSRTEGTASFSAEDLGRFVQANSGLLTFAGLTLGIFVSRKFLVLPVAVALTLAQEMAKDHLGVDSRPRRR
jgi:hypothetical protein